MSYEALVNEFAECVDSQSRSIEQGDAKSGNDYAKRYIAAFEKLRDAGDSGRDALAMLFDDHRPAVRIMAASFLLRHSEKEAMEVLKRDSREPGLVGFGAQQALQRWQEGTWNLDPVER